MDPSKDSNDTRSNLADFLATFETLPANDKAEALKHIIRTQRGETTKPLHASAPASLSSALADAHSCHICKRLSITQNPKEPDAWEPRFASEQIVLTKETLQQGLTQACILVKWAFVLLAQGLHDLKSDLSKRIILPSRPESIRDPSDDLQYLRAEGVVLDCHGLGGDSDEIWIRLTYGIDPFLVDKLWNVAHDLREGWTYEAFESRYNRSVASPFRMTAAADDPASLDCRFRPAVKKMEPEKIVQLARKFLNNCQEGHEICHKRTATLPTRVIDVGTKSPIKLVKLYWSDVDETGQYAALSYCWGGHQPLTTTTSTAQDITDGLLFSRLPRTLQDAMIVTLELGLRYIWIDSLCIIQDDPSDLGREIAKMAETFQGAFVTISAASSSSVHLGFLSDQHTTPRTRIAVPWKSPNVEDGTILVEQSRTAYDPTEDPINLRAWTLQEHILPRRMLVFGTRELWWTCEKEVRFDSLPTRRIHNVPVVQRKSGSDRYSLEYWRLIVRDYTRRFLTYPNDKLSAIAGVADLYSQFFNSRYLAGLWEQALLSELMWCSNRSDISRPLAQRAPTWSWASVDGEIHHNWCPVDPGPHAPKIIECHITPVLQASPFGPVDPNQCILRIQGNLIQAIWQEDRRYISTARAQRRINPNREDEFYHRSGRTHADACEDNWPTEVWVLPITKDPIRGLLLAHVERDVYRRVGLVLRLWENTFMPADDEVRKICII
ncbi:HET-domain-containing protein [Ophiobolus disseminans]|uniref:HET-domain-containing protein n=1 Tax=Ophiobolus disseminans TaxID=1469910 RepID=A0A6A7A2T5_9PLEO|nr:HET-domain-containing protein [Ophiobolus disseminans]